MYLCSSFHEFTNTIMESVLCVCDVIGTSGFKHGENAVYQYSKHLCTIIEVCFWICFCLFGYVCMFREFLLSKVWHEFAYSSHLVFLSYDITLVDSGLEIYCFITWFTVSVKVQFSFVRKSSQSYILHHHNIGF